MLGAQMMGLPDLSTQRLPPVFEGVGVALVTLFDDNGGLLAQQTAEHAAHLVERGVRSVTIAGTTGEAWSLTAGERVELVRACRAVLPGDVPLVVGTGSSNQAEAVRLTAAVRDYGADAVMAISPRAVVNPRPYYDAVADAARGTPVLAYHFPSFAPPGIPVGILAALPVAGIKDSSADADRLIATLELYGGPLYVGSASYLALAGPLGATGAILALANIEPERCIQAFSGDIAMQRALMHPHQRSLEHFPAGLKRTLAEQTGTSPSVRATS
jgi:dihydrodipicolinate synthase/N-acetylneuraminate lyase